MKNKSKILPVLFGFFIMGFCDLVGVSVTYAKDYFSWSETQAGFLPSMVFIWFLLISIPISIWMDKKGRKTISLIGLLSTFIGMLLPLLTFTQTACYIAFALLGIGNTILQVSLNPLLTNVIAEGKLSSIMTAGQFIKALSSFVGPIVAGFCSVYFNNWILMFPIFAAITLISGIWLFFTPINEKDDKRLTSSFYKVISLLKNKTICLLFGGIICIVGLDVGMNVFTPKLLIENAELTKEIASYGTSWYFAARTLGTLCGVILLAKFSEIYYYRINMFIVLIALSCIYWIHSQYIILLLVCIIAFAMSSIFAVIYSLALHTLPYKTNEVSGLMVTGISGGSIIPPLMGVCADYTGSQSGSILVMLICVIYLILCSFHKFKTIHTKPH